MLWGISRQPCLLPPSPSTPFASISLFQARTPSGECNQKRNKVLQFAPKTHPKTCTQNLTLFLYRDDELEDGIGL